MRRRIELTDLVIRPARAEDVPQILAFVKELAAYERLAHEVVATEADLRRGLYGERPVAEAFLAFYRGRPVAYALVVTSFSTFRGKPGLYIEDLIVAEKLRRHGIGRYMMVYLARLAKERGCARLEWSTLDWNRPAIALWHKVGAAATDEWTGYRLSGAALDGLAAEAESGPVVD